MPPQALPAPPAESIHRLPGALLVDREQHLAELARGVRVIHLGFVDVGRMGSKRAEGVWLHELLAASAREIIGIDTDEAGVQFARDRGFEAYVADCEDSVSVRSLDLEPADLVIAGELVEHLDRPGAFLEAVKPLVDSGTLIVTTQNATSLTNFVATLMRRELVNSDHVSWYSWRTLATLLERHAWRPSALAYYTLPRFTVSPEQPRGHRARVRAFNTYSRLVNPVLRLRPPLAEGLILSALRDG